MTIKAVNGHKYAQAREIIHDNGIGGELVSYTTTVITIDDNGWLTVNGLYSMTTIKHIGWFMRERGLTYQLAKELYTDNMIYNILTGEYKAAP